MFRRPFWPMWAWLVLVTALSVMPGVPMPKFNLFSADKLGHAGAYAVLAYLMFRGLKKASSRPTTGKEILAIFCLSTGYGVLMEFVQGNFFPNRFFEIDDMLANALGALLVSAWEYKNCKTGVSSGEPS